ncbi:hypothetical protein DFJ73DRAFT_850634 [Zopfochytrium polystomum]|nr:hypothetical protein DFJ73DRAFT_850634 [Zopfochytrium polystomum]
MHLIVKSPFPEAPAAPLTLPVHMTKNSTLTPPTTIADQINLMEIQRRSDIYYASAPNANKEADRLQMRIREKLGDDSIDSPSSSSSVSASTPGDREKAVLTDIPLPTALTRHILQPSTIYLQQTAVGRVTGFRIEVNGRRGTRANRQVMQHGKLATNQTAKSFVDYGRADFYNKKGSTGVRVWIGYGR